jgi:hypothetical protein
MQNAEDQGVCVFSNISPQFFTSRLRPPTNSARSDSDPKSNPVANRGREAVSGGSSCPSRRTEPGNRISVSIS